MIIQPGLISSISGKLGTDVYNRTRYGITVREKGTVDQPGTVDQVVWNDRIKDLSAKWGNDLTEEDRQQWIQEARFTTRPKRMSGTRQLSGYLLFISRNMNWAAIGFPFSNTPAPYTGFFGTDGSIDQVKNFTMEATASSTKLIPHYNTGYYPGATDGILEVTPIMDPGETWRKNKYRILSAGDPLGFADGGDYWNLYTTMFGVPSPGQIGYARIIPIGINYGQRGIYTETKFTWV